jgi:F0F1-type ATP synthase assembly protein I
MGITTVNCAVFAVGTDGGGSSGKTPDGGNSSSNKSSNKNGPMGSVYTLVVAVAIGVGLGLGIDKYFNSAPWGLLGLSMIFLVAGFYNLIKESNR